MNKYIHNTIYITTGVIASILMFESGAWILKEVKLIMATNTDVFVGVNLLMAFLLSIFLIFGFWIPIAFVIMKLSNL